MNTRAPSSPVHLFISSPPHPVTLSLLLLLVFVSLPARAADPNVWLDPWFARQTNVQTWSADLVQTRSLPALAQPLLSTGHVWVAMPDQFRWQIGQPPQTIALREHDRLWVIYPKLRRAEKYPLNDQQPGPWRDALALLESVFPRSRAELEQRFRVQSVVQTNSLLHVSLEPRSASARKFMPHIQITLRTNDFSLVANEITSVDGSRVLTEYKNPAINAPLPEGCFLPNLPSDFKIVEPARR